MVSRLWSEHKVDAGFRDGQREDYLAALQNLPGDGKLIYVVRAGTTARESGDWRGFTWQEIAELADRAGRREEGRDWRRDAIRPDAVAKQRLRHEFIWFLDEEGFAVVHPFDGDNVLALKLADETEAAVGWLLELAGRSADPVVPTGGVVWADHTAYQEFELPAGCWLGRLTGFEVSVEAAVATGTIGGRSGPASRRSRPVSHPVHLVALLSAVAADEYVLVRLEADAATLRDRIVEREPDSWSGLPDSSMRRRSSQ